MLAAAMFGAWGCAGGCSAQAAQPSYVDIELLLDNSSSMDFGATNQDMAILQNLSACDASNAEYANGSQSAETYGLYAYAADGRTYDGALAVPVVLTGGTDGPITLTQDIGAAVGPPCAGWLPPVGGVIPGAGPPCAFACHWDSTHNSGLAQDLYGVARRTLGTANPVTLRFDLVKNATNQVLAALQSYDTPKHNLRAGVFTFNTKVSAVYPRHGEAGDEWAAAQAAVGTPPDGPFVNETGIQPVIALRQNEGVNDNTYFTRSMNRLSSKYLVADAGDGTSRKSPRKALFILSDGFEDAATGKGRGRAAFDPAVCQQFKAKGYAVYVIYVPYYPVMHLAYLLNDWSLLVNGTGPTSISYNLQQCASSPADSFSIEDGPMLHAVVQELADPQP